MRPRVTTENNVWDVALLKYVPMTQPGGGSGGGGDASAANQTTEIARLTSLLAELQLKADLTETQPVSLASVPLPTGAATGAKQDTGNTSLGNIDTKTPALGQAVAAASVPVVLPATQITTLTPPAAITGFSTEATLALIKAKTDNLDVLLSTRTKPADQQHVIVDSSASIAVTGPLTDTQLRASAVPIKEGGTHWATVHAPAAATKPTISRAAAGAGIKNVCTSITITLSSAAAPTVGIVDFRLIDGASGGATILWQGKLSLPATAGSAASITTGAIWIEGTANTVMTLEAAAAPAANVVGTVAISGTTTT